MIATTSFASAQQAQPQPQPQPQWQSPPPAQPQPAPQQHGAWYRFTLNDGRVIDVQIVGGDATSYHVMTGGALYSIPRANVLSSVALQPAVMYTPPPPPPAPEPARKPGNKRMGGIATFGVWYGLTAMIAAARDDNDSSARAGFVPVIGPILWTVSNDEDDFLEDGWDWLAVTDTLVQGIGVYWIITGGQDSSSTKVSLTPVTRRNFHGFAVGGSF